MSRTITSGVHLGKSKVGISLTPKLYNDANALVNANFGTMTEIGGGDYTHVGTYADDFDGTVRLYNGVTYVSFFSINAEVISSGGGTGVNTILLIVKDIDTNALIVGASVRLTLGSSTWVQVTDDDGKVVFNLDNGDYTVAITAMSQNYMFNGAVLHVAGDVVPVYYMTPNPINPSPLPGQATGIITCFDANGGIQSGADVVMVLVSGPISGKGLALSKTSVTKVSGSSGQVQFPGMWWEAKYKYRKVVNGVPGDWIDVLVPSDVTEFDLINVVGP